MLSPTYEITTALSHTDELISPPYDIAIVTISYGRVTMSPVWDSMMSKKNMGLPFYAAVVALSAQATPIAFFTANLSTSRLEMVSDFGSNIRRQSEIVYTRLYLNKLESIMRTLSDALPTGHRAMANPTLQLHFELRKGHSAGKPLPQLAIREDAKFFVQNWTKNLFFANKDPKTNFDDWMILQKHVLSFKCNDFF